MSETPARYEVPLVCTPVMHCPVAGFQHYEGESCWSRLRSDDLLALRREPGNRHDPRAIAIEWQGAMLGYVPREANYMLSQMMDRGTRVVARVVSLRESSDPWDRVMIEVGCHVFGPGQAPSPARDGDVAFQPSGILLRSLGRRIFGGDPPEYAIEWIHARVAALALIGVERPGLLPFLKFVPGRANAAAHDDPVAALEWILRAAGIEPGALKRLALWEFRSFEGLGRWLKPAPIASLANLLLRLDVQAPPPPGFTEYAHLLALHGLPVPPSVPDLGRHPLWFMRALFRAFAIAHESGAAAPTREEAVRCVDWVIDTRPTPDPNQQHAGWPWIVQRANAHAKARMLAGVERPWPTSIGERVYGRWRVVPIRTLAQLDAEAAAMKNCLADYLLACITRDMEVYSIRDQLTGERKACFSVLRDAEDDSRELGEIAGIANTRVSAELEALALRVIAEMGRP